ncbi:MAG TPA: NAD+ synthase [Thermotogota bacterium]|nr:NAD+ synthase [Thermotogota bacterium]
MKKALRVAVSQLNTITGALNENVKNLEQGIALGHEIGADALIFPELCLNGLNCQGLSKNRTFLRETRRTIDEIIQFSKGKQPLIVFGFLEAEEDCHYSSAGVIQNGKWLGSYRKIVIQPENDGVDTAFFSSGEEGIVLNIEGIKAGIVIGNDLWDRYDLISSYDRYGVCVLFHLSAFTFLSGEYAESEQRLFSRSKDFEMGIVHANAIGGQDQWIYSGNSMIFDGHSRIKARGKMLEEDFVVADIELPLRGRKAETRATRCGLRFQEWPVKRIDCDFSASFKPEINSKIYDYPEDESAAICAALQLSLRDYVGKNRFEKVVLVLSGGIDSAVVAALSVASLGRERVVGVIMPSKYTTEASVKDAEELANALQIKTITLPIDDLMDSYGDVLGTEVELKAGSLCEQNLQPRIRANLLLALSNHNGWLVLTTGNKSEWACGYTTLFGDSAGGFAPLKDLYKHQVYALGRTLNQALGTPAITENHFSKVPTAELYPGQTDQDRLPPYEEVDPIVRLMVEEGYSADEVVKEGFREESVRKVWKMYLRSEFKRRVSPVGPKLTKVSFNGEQGLPITQQWV